MTKNKSVYGYLIVSDKGFAPCYDDELFTLACCKPDIRKSIFNNHTDSDGNLMDEVWLVAAKHSSTKNDGKYNAKLVYVAKITKALKFEDYYGSDECKKRADCIYQNLSTDKCKRIIAMPDAEKESKLKTLIKKAYIGRQTYHRIKNKSRPAKNELDQFRRDISGLCVLVSEEYYYFGETDDFGEFSSVRKHCENKRPGKYFYVDIASEEINSFIARNKNYKKTKALVLNNSKSKCSC